MRLLIILSSLLLSPVTPFTTILRSSSSSVLLNNNNKSRRIISNRSVVLSMSSSDASPPSSSRPKQSPQTLSIAILGGGISGLSCASQLLSRHKQQCYNQQQQQAGGKEAGAEGGCCDYELEVTIFDTGRLRPGGRCSSRFVGDKPPIVKNRSSGVTPVKRACDAEEFLQNDGTNGSSNDELAEGGTPSNILKAIYSSNSSSGGNGGGGDSMARILNSMGPIDHAAQIISIPKLDGDDGMEEFQKQVEQWVASDVLESFPAGSVVELLGGDSSGGRDNNSIKLEPLHGNMYYGKGGMGNIPLKMRDYCLSFNGYGDNYTGQSFRIAQDVWVSPSNGVKYIGSGRSGGGGNDDDDDDDDDDGMPQWELRAGSKSLGKYHKLVIAHNGKCADRIMSKTPAKEFHSLLRTKFAPYVPEWGGREMTLNSIYSLVFAVKSDKNDDDGSGDGTSSIAKAISNLCTSSSSNSHDDGVYTIMIKNEPTLRLLSCNTLKHHHRQNPNSQSNIQIYTLLSSPKFGKQFKGPQEALPLDLQTRVVMKMLSNLENSLGLQKGDVVNEVVDLKLQLWGAAVPMNTWSSSSSTSSSSSSSNRVDGFVYDTKYGVGAAGDWILDPSIAGAWESGRRLADWILKHHEKKEDVDWSVGLPDFTNNGGKQKGKFVPSRVALESGIGTIPPSPYSTFKFPSNNDEGNQRGGRGGGRGRGRGRGPGRGGRGRGGGGRNGQRASNGGGRNSNRREMQQQKVG